MGLTLTTLGARLRQARLNACLTQEDAAAAIKIPRTAVVQVEAGNRNITSIELFSLAKLYKIDVALLLSEEEEIVNDSPLLALCRMRPEFAQTQLKKTIAWHLDIYQQGIELNRLLGDRVRASAPFYELSDPRSYAEAIKQGEAMAFQERKRLGLNTLPISDVAELISNQGIWASASDNLPEDLSGLFMHSESIGLAILINGKHPRKRRRFSYAHEYAHALVDRNQSSSALVTGKFNAQELVEKRANAFASEFLIPAAGIEEALTRFDKGARSRESLWMWDYALEQGEEVERRNKPGSQAVTYQDVACLSHEYTVSYEMVVYRLSDMGVINRTRINELIAEREKAKELMELLAELVPDENEQATEQPYLKQQIGFKAIEAYRRNAITTECFVEICSKLELNVERTRRVVAVTRAIPK
jgi:Zn-dependent peptidase ImmA (M78 family)/DNA-binding XRE family transcriptional regulator